MAGRQAVVHELRGLSLVTGYRSSLQSDEAEAKLWAIASELGIYPGECVSRGCREYARANKWFPELAEILPYVKAEHDAMKSTLSRLERMQAKAQGREEQKRGGAWKKPTQVDKETVAVKVKELKRYVAEQEAAERMQRRKGPEPPRVKPYREGLPEGPGTRAARRAKESVDHD